MRRFPLALAVALLNFGAAAQPRPSTEAMTCGQAMGLVAARGAIVLSTGQFTYDRFVRDARFCVFDEEAGPVFVRTRDVAQCPLYRCVARRPFFDDE